MRKITVGFSRPKGKIFPVFSWAIRAYQGWTDYSHTYVKFTSSSLGRDIVYQASGLQVNFIGSKLFYDHVHVIDEFEFEVTDEAYKKVMQFCIDNAGKPYSMRDIFAILLKIDKLLDGNKKFICSELVAHILQDCINISCEKAPGLVTPKDLYSLLKSLFRD